MIITRKLCPTCGRTVDVVADPAAPDLPPMIARHFAPDRIGFCGGSTLAAPHPKRSARGGAP